MNMPPFLQAKIDNWRELETSKKAAVIGVIVVGGAVWYNNHLNNAAAAEAAKAAKVRAAQQAEAKRASGDAATPDPAAANPNVDRVLPKPNRNMGLEELSAEVSALRAELGRLRTEQGGRGGAAADPVQPSPAASGSSANFTPPAPRPATAPSLDAPAPVSFDAPGARTSDAASRAAAPALSAPDLAPPAPPAPKLKVWDRTAVKETAAAELPPMVIPVNSGIDAVMLTGVAARPAASQGGGAAGAVTGALQIGAPFVTRLKGDALMPNGWRHARLNDCFLSGEGIGSLSMERVNAIADKVSCIDEDGRVWEGSPKAYAVDADGTQGIAGHVVSRQGRLLAQAALAGIASGLGSALAPQAVGGYQSNASSGTQAFQSPSAAFVAQSAVASGFAQANSLLAKFYLDYAKEIFPLVEVPAGTRVTWILRESLELRPKKTN